MSNEVVIDAQVQDGSGTSVDAATETQSPEAVTPEGEQAEQQEQGSEYMTRAEADKLRKEIEEAENRMRSYADKGRVRVEKAVESQAKEIERLRKKGVEISPDQERKLIEDARYEAMAETESDTPDGQAQPSAEAQQYVAETLYADSLRLEGKHGFSIDPADPEVAMMKITGNPDQDKANQAAMFEAKATRLASAPPTQSNTQATDTKAAVRTGAVTTGTSQSEQALINELTAMQKLPANRENMERRAEILKKLEAFDK